VRKITGKITGSQEDNRVRLEADRVEADRVEADRVNPAILRYSRYSVVSSQRPACSRSRCRPTSLPKQRKHRTKSERGHSCPPGTQRVRFRSPMDRGGSPSGLMGTGVSPLRFYLLFVAVCLTASRSGLLFVSFHSLPSLTKTTFTFPWGIPAVRTVATAVSPVITSLRISQSAVVT